MFVEEGLIELFLLKVSVWKICMFSVSEQFPAFAPACRLALKWLSSQMLSQFIDSIMVETIMADVFLRPFTGYQPRFDFKPSL